MKVTFLLLAVVGIAVESAGQQPIANVEISSFRPPDRLQCFAVHDSVFLSYWFFKEAGGEHRYQELWILPDGTSRNCSSTVLRGKVLCGITSHSRRRNRFYSLNADKKGFNVGMVEADQNDDRVVAPDTLRFNGRFLGSYTDGEDLFIFSADKKTYRLTVTQVRGLTAVRKNDFTLPIDLSDYNDSQIAFNQSGTPLTVGESVARVRIAYQKKRISVVIDVPYEDGSPRPAGTTIADIDRESGETNTTFIQCSTTEDFRSVPVDHYLFRISYPWAGARLEVFSLQDGKLVRSQTFFSDKLLKTKRSYLRQGKEGRISATNAWNVLNYPGLPFLTATKDSAAARYVIAIGRHLNSKGGIVVSPHVVAGIVASVIFQAVLPSHEAPGEGMYCYLVGGPDQGFDFVPGDDTASISQKMDAYELGVRLWFRKIFPMNNHVLGLYMNDKASTLRLVKF
jgi:hypothetical protein